jgi:hypothetical protein
MSSAGSGLKLDPEEKTLDAVGVPSLISRKTNKTCADESVAA